MNLRTEILPSDEVGDMISFGVNGQRLFLLGVFGVGLNSPFVEGAEENKEEQQKGETSVVEKVSQCEDQKTDSKEQIGNEASIYGGMCIGLSRIENLVNEEEEVNEEMDQVE